MNKQSIDTALMASPKLWRESLSQVRTQHHLKKIQPYDQITLEKVKLKEQQFCKQEDVVLSPSKQYLDFKLQTDSLLPSIQEESEPDTPIATMMDHHHHRSQEKPKKEKTRPSSLYVPSSKLKFAPPTPDIPAIPININLPSDSSSSSSSHKRHTMCLSKKSNHYVPNLDIPKNQLLFTSNDINSLNNASTENKRIKALRFNVVQLASLTSERDLDYELSILLNEKAIDTRQGQMKKLSKKMSSCTFSKNWMDIQLDTPFELTFIIKTKPARPHKVADFFTRRGQWSLFKKGKGISSTTTANYMPSIEKNEMNKTTSLESIENNHHHHHVDFSTVSPSGYVRIFSGEQFELIKQGKYRYKFNKSLSSSSYSTHTKAIEVVVDFQWYHRLVTESPIPKESSITQLSQEYNKLMLTDSMKHAHHGDYLTFYYWGNGLPEWRRYWTVLENNKLLLKPCGYKKKEYLYNISLKKLVKVSKPTEEDQENIYLSRQLGVVLQFDIAKMQISERVDLGKMYILTDNKSSAESWRHALSNIKPNKSNDEGNVDTRFLW